jgi:hypothetical protein
MCRFYMAEENSYKTIFVYSFEYIKKFVTDHPGVIYKGVPLAVALYILSPVLVVVWRWLPWIWAVYEVYRHVPPGSVPAAIEFLKNAHENI